MLTVLLLLFVCPATGLTRADAKWEVLLASDATVDEAYAARELSGFLGNASGLAVPTAKQRSPNPGTVTFAVGYGAATSVGLAPATLEGMGNESYRVTSNASGLVPGCVAVTGGRLARRGALYAVYHLLGHLGFRFFAPDETAVPSAAALMLAVAVPVDVRFMPAMELRSLESFETNGGGAPRQLWPLRNRVNGQGGQPAGGTVQYAEPPGSVHTSYGLLYSDDGAGEQRTPPPDLYKEHPEWFWPQDDPSKYGTVRTGISKYFKASTSFCQTVPYGRVRTSLSGGVR